MHLFFWGAWCHTSPWWFSLPARLHQTVSALLPFDQDLRAAGRPATLLGGAQGPADPTDPSRDTAHDTGHVAGDRDGPELLWSGLILVPWDHSGGDQEFMSAVGNWTLEIKRSFGLLQGCSVETPSNFKCKTWPWKKVKTTHFHNMQKGNKGLHVLLWFVHVSTPRRVSILSSWIYPLTLYKLLYCTLIQHMHIHTVFIVSLNKRSSMHARMHFVIVVCTVNHSKTYAIYLFSAHRDAENIA